MIMFQEIVHNIAGRLGISGLDDNIDYGGNRLPVSATDIANAVSDICQEDVNCYPGIPGSGCHSKAFFFALKNPQRTKGRGHLSMENALDQLMIHMTGRCGDVTNEVIVIVDHWDPKAFEKWATPIRKLRTRISLEIFLIAGDSIVNIPF